MWCFGVLLWEMLAGHALFGGDTVTDVIAAVVTREPDLAARPEATPAVVRKQRIHVLLNWPSLLER